VDLIKTAKLPKPPADFRQKVLEKTVHAKKNNVAENLK